MLVLANPLVSVIIPNYNYSRYLSKTIDSVLSQTYRNIEVVVVDDGSTDNSLSVIESYGKQVVSVRKENGGQASAFNAGYENCKGDIICLLDADDLFLPHKLSTVVDLFQEDPEIGWVFVESVPMKNNDLDNRSLDSIHKELKLIDANKFPKKIDIRNKFLNGFVGGFAPSTSNLCFSRCLLEKIFPLPEAKGFSCMAMTDLYMKVLAMGLSIGYRTEQNLGIFRIHDNIYTTSEVNKKRRMFGEIYTTTGYWMNINFPQFSIVNMKIISKGYATYRKSNYLLEEVNGVDCDEMFRQYVSGLSFLERLKVKLLFRYYSLKLSFRDFA